MRSSFGNFNTIARFFHFSYVKGIGIREAQKGKQTPVGLQLYTVRDLAKKDFARTLKQVAQIGYDSVEFAGFGGCCGNCEERRYKETEKE